MGINKSFDELEAHSVETDRLNGTYRLYSGTGEDIQAAVDVAHDNGGGIVYLGPYEFTVSSTIQLHGDVRLVGQGRSTVLKLADGANTDLISVLNSSVFEAQEGISHLQLHGNRANNSSGRGVVVYPFSLRFHLHDINVTQFAGNGVQYIDDTQNSEGIYEPIITQTEINECDGNGLVLEGNCPDMWLANTSSSNNIGHGFVFGSGGHSLVHAHAVTNQGDGIVFEDCTKTWAYDAYGDTNDGHGIRITNSESLFFVGGHSMKNGTTENPKDGVYLDTSYSNRFVGMSMDDPRSSGATQRYGVHEDSASGNYFALCMFGGGNTQGGFEGSLSTEHIENQGYSNIVQGVFTGTGDGSTTKFNAGTLGFSNTPVDPDDVLVVVSGAGYGGSDPAPSGCSVGYDSNGDVNSLSIHYATAPADGASLRARWKATHDPT